MEKVVVSWGCSHECGEGLPKGRKFTHAESKVGLMQYIFGTEFMAFST